MAVSNEYGKALFLLSEEGGNTEAALDDVRAANEIFSKNPEYVKLLDTPAITKAEKLTLIDEAFNPLCESVRNLIKILCEKHSVFSFSEVAKTYFALYDESRGIEHVEAVTAIAMTQSQLDAMKAKLAKITGKRIIIKNTVDPKILGGVKIRYSGIQIDGSVKTRLDKFEEGLKNTVI